MDLLEQAARQGNPNAQHELGNAYDSGISGLRKDMKKAAYWSEKAARQGDSAAQVNTCIAYLVRRGRRPGHRGGHVLARARGEERGTRERSTTWELSIGTAMAARRDLGLARYWLEVAAERGIEDAKEALAELGKSGGT